MGEGELRRGFEVEVLKGAEETLRVWRPALIVEIQRREAMYLIRDSGYVFRVHHGADYLALPEEKAEGAPPSR
jgi:hypothetical protein